MAMSRTMGSLALGMARMRGLLPRAGVVAPQGGRLGRVLVQQRAAQPASAACQP